MSITKGVHKEYWVHHCEGLPGGVYGTMEALVEGDYVNWQCRYCPQCGEALPRFVSPEAEQRHAESIARLYPLITCENCGVQWEYLRDQVRCPQCRTYPRR